MKSFLPNDIKDQNRKVIFEILLQEPELAKVELTERTTMSFVTVSKIVEHFEEIGIVTKSGESREGSGGLGRKRVVYHFNPNSYTTIGVQIIGKRASAVLINLYGKVVASYATNKKVAFAADELLKLLNEITAYFQPMAERMNSTIVGVGIGIDGAINMRKGTIRMKADGNREVDFAFEPIRDELHEALNLPVYFENDVNAATIAEFNILGRENESIENLLHIAAGEGIGAGLIIDKKLHRGNNAGVGEMEYMCFDTEYVKSPSEVGWLESRIGLDYLAEAFHYSIDAPGTMDLEERKAGIDYVAKHLGLAISNVVSLLDITYVILSGETISAFPQEIKEKTKEYINRFTGWELELVVSNRQDSTAVGAALLMLEKEMGKIISD